MWPSINGVLVHFTSMSKSMWHWPSINVVIHFHMKSTKSYTWLWHLKQAAWNCNIDFHSMLYVILSLIMTLTFRVLCFILHVKHFIYKMTLTEKSNFMVIRLTSKSYQGVSRYICARNPNNICKMLTSITDGHTQDKVIIPTGDTNE